MYLNNCVSNHTMTNLDTSQQKQTFIIFFQVINKPLHVNVFSQGQLQEWTEHSATDF